MLTLAAYEKNQLLGMIRTVGDGHTVVFIQDILVFRKALQVVVIDRKKQDWLGVTFPGGHVEPEESFTDAVIREVLEERYCKPAPSQE